MNFILRLFFCLCLISSKTLSAFEQNEPISPLAKPLYREYEQSRFNLKFYQGFGFRNFAWDLELNFQVRQYFTIGVGNGFHRNKYPIFSTSDKHILKMWSYPMYFTTSIFIVSNSKRAIYIYGKYGRSFGLDTKGVSPDDAFKAKFMEGGIGYQMKYEEKSLYFELGQYYTTAKGEFNSTYNSTINYDLEIYTLVAKVGFRLHL